LENVNKCGNVIRLLEGDNLVALGINSVLLDAIYKASVLIKLLEGYENWGCNYWRLLIDVAS